MQLFSELGRRRVIRGAGLYAVVAWITTEVSATVLPLLGVAEKYVTGIVITLVVLFPVVMILVWVYDIGPAGTHRTPELKEERGREGRPGMLFRVSLLVLAMVVLGYGLFWLGSTRALQSIGRAFGELSSSVYLQLTPHGGIDTPAKRINAGIASTG